MTADAAWAALEAVRADVPKLVRDSDPFPMTEPIAPHPRFGPWTFRQWVVFAGGHDARHADQIREMLPAFGPPAIASSVLRTIGRTPVVRLRKVVPEGAAEVLVKLEFFNPTGSYKDRMALAMIEGAERRGALKPGMRVVEFTGGSTGSSLAMVCALKGYKVHPDLVGRLRRREAEDDARVWRGVEDCAERRRKGHAGAVRAVQKEIAVLAAEPDTFWTDQFNNADALDGYAEIGRELLEQAGRIDVFCGAVGTGGLLAGVTRALRAGGSTARIVALEPASSPRDDRRPERRASVEGIATGRIPPNMQTSRTTRRGRSGRGRARAGPPRWRAKKVARRHLERAQHRRRDRYRARARPGQGRRDGGRRYGTEVLERRPLRR